MSVLVLILYGIVYAEDFIGGWSCQIRGFTAEPSGLRVCRQAQRRHFISSFSVSEGLQGPNTWKPSSLGFSKAPESLA